MRLLRACVVGEAALWLVSVALGAGGKPAGSARATPGIQWDKLTQAIKTIETAKEVKQVAAAYAEGCTVNRKSVKLQRAYMRRMLKLGRPDVAYHAAQMLVQIEPRNGLAWGTVGYVQASGGQLAQGLVPCLKGAQLEPGNPSIAQNAAQILAWYEGTAKRPKLADAGKQVLDSVKSASSRGGALAKAYRSAKAVYAKLADERKEAEQHVSEAEAEAKKVEQALEKVATTIRARGKSYESEERGIYSLRRSLARTEYNLSRTGDYHRRQSLERGRERIIRSIRDKQRNCRKLLDEGKKLQKDKHALMSKLRVRRDKVAALRRESDRIAAGVPRAFRWQPPAVDGVVTPPRKATASASPKSSSAGKNGGKSGSTPSGKALSTRVAEAEAADKLGLAKLYLESKLNDSAKKLLQQILTKYANTAAAKEAATLIKKLP